MFYNNLDNQPPENHSIFRRLLFHRVVSSFILTHPLSICFPDYGNLTFFGESYQLFPDLEDWEDLDEIGDFETLEDFVEFMVLEVFLDLGDRDEE